MPQQRFTQEINVVGSGVISWDESDVLSSPKLGPVAPQLYAGRWKQSFLDSAPHATPCNSPVFQEGFWRRGVAGVSGSGDGRLVEGETISSW